MVFTKPDDKDHWLVFEKKSANEIEVHRTDETGFITDRDCYFVSGDKLKLTASEFLHFVAEPYLDIGNGKTWRPAVASTIASMAESEQKARQMMVNGFKMSESQWEYTFRCFEIVWLF